MIQKSEKPHVRHGDYPSGWIRQFPAIPFLSHPDGRPAVHFKFIAATMSLRETLVAASKYCLSFRKSKWDLSDYPVVIREQRIDRNPGFDPPRFEQHRYLARVVKWWVLNGGGNTPREAMHDLAAQFEKKKTDANANGKPLPRPGTTVPVEFASTEHVDADPELANDFIRRVLGLDWAFISDGSSLWDFHTERSNDAFYTKIEEIYGVDVSDITSANLAEILNRIAAERRR